MRSLPDGISADDVADAVEHRWGLRVEQLDYLPKGSGAYHWQAEDDTGRQWFVTCDDLTTKPWLGDNPDSVFLRLQTAYATAVDLHDRHGLAFVAAPLPALSGEPAIRVGPDHSVALFPFLDGTNGSWGEPLGTFEKAELVNLLAQLHRSSPSSHLVPRRSVTIPWRDRLETALTELDRPWQDGPFSEHLRNELAVHAGAIAEWFATFDNLATRPARPDSEPVLTHGEPHPGNLMRTGAGFMLVDWDTVALDQPERDLWMIDDGGGSAWAIYEQTTGRAIDPERVEFYRLAWKLTDLAAFTAQLRSPHDRNGDTEKAWMTIHKVLTTDEPAPYGSCRPGKPT